MNRHLRSVPTQDRQELASPDAQAAIAPEFGPVDEVTCSRLRLLAESHLEPTPAIELHLDLLDVRGAWYAEHIIAGWRRDQPDAIWGVVNHYVRTHLGDPRPALDLAAWVSAGEPDTPMLQRRWRDLAEIYPRDLLAADGEVDRGSVAHMDAIVASWPENLFLRFQQAYVIVEATLCRAGLSLPPVTD